MPLRLGTGVKVLICYIDASAGKLPGYEICLINTNNGYYHLEG